MGGIINGLSLHGGTIPIGGTFFVFSDYMRGAVRLAALSQAKVIYFWTHDSVGLGQDGPTHQPVEQLAAMRAMPDFGSSARPTPTSRRTPCGWPSNATAPRPSCSPARPCPCWPAPTPGRSSSTGGPSADRGQRRSRPGAHRDRLGSGGLCGRGRPPGGGRHRRPGGVHAELELFDEQDDDYQDSVLGSGSPVLSVEAAASFGWPRWADDSVSLDHFGASAPGAEVLAEFGFTAENVADRAMALLEELEYDDEDDLEGRMNDAFARSVRRAGQSPWIDNLRDLRPRRAPARPWSTRASGG